MAKSAKSLSLASFDHKIYGACDITRRSNCSGAMNYAPELAWILFLRIFDALEEQDAKRAAVLGLDFSSSCE